jgi:hypothetical protein
MTPPGSRCPGRPGGRWRRRGVRGRLPVIWARCCAPLPARLGNQFGLVFVRLPTGESDPVRRRARVKGPGWNATA